MLALLYETLTMVAAGLEPAHWQVLSSVKSERVTERVTCLQVKVFIPGRRSVYRSVVTCRGRAWQSTRLILFSCDVDDFF